MPSGSRRRARSCGRLRGFERTRAIRLTRRREAAKNGQRVAKRHGTVEPRPRRAEQDLDRKAGEVGKPGQPILSDLPVPPSSTRGRSWLLRSAHSDSLNSDSPFECPTALHPVNPVQPPSSALSTLSPQLSTFSPQPSTPHPQPLLEFLLSVAHQFLLWLTLDTVQPLHLD